MFETLWQQGYRNIGVALQSYLHRTEQDVRRMNELGARVRLVKGAYKEPPSVAYQNKADVDAAFVRLMRLLLDEGNYPAIATHDPAMLDATKAYATERGITTDRYEFQMLFGIRRDLQASLVAQGYPDADLHPVRPAVVPVFHAATGRTSGERRIRVEIACSRALNQHR